MKLFNKKTFLALLVLLLIFRINDRIHRNITPSKYENKSSLNDSSKLSRWGIDYSPFNYNEDGLESYLTDTIGIQKTDNSLTKLKKCMLI